MQSNPIFDFMSRVARVRYVSFLTFISVMIFAVTAPAQSQEKGTVDRVIVDGSPVIYEFVDGYPSAEIRAKYPWLAVVVWQFDGSDHDGMPSEALLKQMDRLEQRLDALTDEGRTFPAFSRTGNHRKEFAYFIHDQNGFTAALSNAVSDGPRYPIHTDIYKVEPWEAFKKLRSSIQSGSGNP